MHQGERLKWLIDKSGKSRQDIALEAGISPASIYNYFREETINSKKLEKLAKALGVTVNDFNDLPTPPTLQEDQAVYLLRERVKTLEQMIHDKEVIIIQQQEVIDLLKQQRISKQKK